MAACISRSNIRASRAACTKINNNQCDISPNLLTDRVCMAVGGWSQMLVLMRSIAAPPLQINNLPETSCEVVSR